MQLEAKRLRVKRSCKRNDCESEFVRAKRTVGQMQLEAKELRVRRSWKRKECGLEFAEGKKGCRSEAVGSDRTARQK